MVAREVGLGGEEAWVLSPQLQVLRGNWASPLHAEESLHLPPLCPPSPPPLLRREENALMAYSLGSSEDHHQIGEPNIGQLHVMPHPSGGEPWGPRSWSVVMQLEGNLASPLWEKSKVRTRGWP